MPALQQLQQRSAVHLAHGSKPPISIMRRSTAPRMSAQRTGENLLARVAVGALTEGLRLAGVGAREYQAAAAAAPPQRALRRGDVGGVLRLLREDYARQYFVTGVLSDEIYEEDCLYADPTVSFSGRELYKRNLALLVPFLWDPAIQLRSLKRLPPQPDLAGPAAGSSSSGGSRQTSRGQRQQQQEREEEQQPQPWWAAWRGQGQRAQQAPVQLFAEWQLTCWLRLPWAPYVRINGTTTYTLNADCNKIVRHVEAWDVSAAQALLLLLRPSERAVWRRWGQPPAPEAGQQQLQQANGNQR